MAQAEEKRTLLMREVVRDPSHLAELRRELDTLSHDDRKEWALNAEFYKGNQWVRWNNITGSVESLGVDDTDKPRHKIRLTADLIKGGVSQLVAQMTKTRPTIRAVPNSGADRDIKAAEMAERLYEHWWDQLGLDTKLISALTHAQISQGYWLITWDGFAGASMEVVLDPETGMPIWDEDFADIFREEIRQAAEAMGVPPAMAMSMVEQTLYMGEIRVQVLGGSQVWLDPTAQNFEDCAYAICKFPMSVEEIQSRYGKTATPDASTGDRKPALVYTKQKDERPKNVRDVYILYHRPTASLPKGRYVVWIESPNEILYQSDWEFPLDILPLVKFPGIERPGSVYDEARTTSARPLQKELNALVSAIAMHRVLTLNQQMLAPTGSLRQKLTNEPGAVIEYNPIAGLAPQWREVPSLPSWVFTNLDDVQRRLDRMFNLMPTERSALPARTDSGHLVELVQEAVADQISAEIRRIERALARAGDIMAAYAQKYYSEPRLLRIKGPSGSVQAKKFLNVDIRGGYSFSAEAGSGLPRTRAGQVQQIRELMEMGVLSPQEALPYLPIAGLKGVQERLQADEDFAHRRVEKLMRGEPVNVPAMQQALMQVQNDGRNPMTGDFFASPEEALAFVEEAALSPLPHENLAVTAFVVGQHMKSTQFEKYAPEIQDRFYKHFQLIQQALGSQAQAAEPVKTTLSLKGTVGPTVAADILQQSGIQSATPETMAEPPLETSVYDSMDKPDADEAGNDPLTELEQIMALQQQQAQNDLKQAKAAQSIAHAEERHQAALRASEEQRRRAAERPKAA